MSCRGFVTKKFGWPLRTGDQSIILQGLYRPRHQRVGPRRVCSVVPFISE